MVVRLIILLTLFCLMMTAPASDVQKIEEQVTFTQVGSEVQRLHCHYSCENVQFTAITDT